ncbi:MAG: hypothetical protein ABR979_00640 [Halobacteriota archaeon]|jgi:hypothetical protein
METTKNVRSADRRAEYNRRALEGDLLKLTIAVSAELLIFLIWFLGPARERYEVLVHVALPVCIVFPIINYRYLPLVPLIAFLPDAARALGIEISHSLVLLPIIFIAAAVPFINRPRTALIACYAAFAIVASHFIVDARNGTAIGNVAGYPWSNLVLYALALTLLGFVLLQRVRLTETREGENYNTGLPSAYLFCAVSDCLLICIASQRI